MGVWWIVLFDIVMGSDPSHTRRVHFSELLQSTKRALRMHCAEHATSRRPLIILDHFDHALTYSTAGHASAGEATAVRAMLVKLCAWAAAVCYDERLADVCVCVSGRRGAKRFESPEEFHRQLLKWAS